MYLEMDAIITQPANLGEKRLVCRSIHLSITANFGVMAVDDPLS